MINELGWTHKRGVMESENLKDTPFHFVELKFLVNCN